MARRHLFILKDILLHFKDGIVMSAFVGYGILCLIFVFELLRMLPYIGQCFLGRKSSNIQHFCDVLAQL